MSRPRKKKRSLDLKSKEEIEKDVEQDKEYDSLMNGFDYFLGYLPVPDDIESFRDIDDVYNQLGNFDWDLRPKLPELSDPKEDEEEVTWNQVAIKWDYIPPEVLSDEKKCLKYTGQLEDIATTYMTYYEQSETKLINCEVLLNTRSKDLSTRSNELREAIQHINALHASLVECKKELSRLDFIQVPV